MWKKKYPIHLTIDNNDIMTFVVILEQMFITSLIKSTSNIEFFNGEHPLNRVKIKSY